MKKHTVIYDEIGLKKGGLYCIFPFEKLTLGKGSFKIGYADKFRSRMENYHSFPYGVYLVSFLEEPRVEGKTRIQSFAAIEKEIFKLIETQGDKIIKFSLSFWNCDLSFNNGRTYVWRGIDLEQVVGSDIYIKNIKLLRLRLKTGGVTKFLHQNL
jgi:hypothetical protein